MLVLNRKTNQRIFIGDKIIITVVYAERGRARIGIEAPKNVPVFREEVLGKNNPQRDDESPF